MASGCAQCIIADNVILDQANDAIYDNGDNISVSIITENSLLSWGNHAYESTSSGQHSLFSDNYALGDGAATGSAILNVGSCSILNNFVRDSNAFAILDTTTASQPHPVTGNDLQHIGGYPALSMGGNSIATGNALFGGSNANGPAVSMVGAGGSFTGNFVNGDNSDGVATASANSFIIANNTISLNLSSVSSKCGIRLAGDQILGRTKDNAIQISCNTANLNYGVCNVPTGTHNLGMMFDGDTVATTLSGGATVDGFLLDNTAGLNTNWQVTVQNIGCVHLTDCLKRIDAQNNKTAYMNIQPTDAALDAGTGSTNDVFAFDNMNFTFATLPSPAGNGSRFYCTDCTQAKPTMSSGGGAFVVREAGQWNGL